MSGGAWLWPSRSSSGSLLRIKLILQEIRSHLIGEERGGRTSCFWRRTPFRVMKTALAPLPLPLGYTTVEACGASRAGCPQRCFISRDVLRISRGATNSPERRCFFTPLFPFTRSESPQLCWGGRASHRLIPVEARQGQKRSRWA